MHYNFNSACPLNAFYNICSGTNMPNKNLIITYKYRKAMLGNSFFKFYQFETQQLIFIFNT